MQKVAQFFKVSLNEFSESMKSVFGNKYTDKEIEDFYSNIDLPKRATVGSAGYDFFSPFSFQLNSWEEVLIPTGIKVKIKEGWFLGIYPRSGLGMRHYLRPANLTSVIDSDYYGAPSNEGHIMIKLRKEKTASSDKEILRIEDGQAYCQGIFQVFGITEDDSAVSQRTGGFGSTGN